MLNIVIWYQIPPVFLSLYIIPTSISSLSTGFPTSNLDLFKFILWNSVTKIFLNYFVWSLKNSLAFLCSHREVLLSKHRLHSSLSQISVPSVTSFHNVQGPSSNSTFHFSVFLNHWLFMFLLFFPLPGVDHILFTLPYSLII